MIVISILTTIVLTAIYFAYHQANKVKFFRANLQPYQIVRVDVGTHFEHAEIRSVYNGNCFVKFDNGGFSYVIIKNIYPL